jgi:hypothetical protein
VLVFVQQQTKEHKLTAKAVARIFHGISSPSFPALKWYLHPRWGKFTHIPFTQIEEIAAVMLNNVRQERQQQADLNRPAKRPKIVPSKASLPAPKRIQHVHDEADEDSELELFEEESASVPTPAVAKTVAKTVEKTVEKSKPAVADDEEEMLF